MKGLRTSRSAVSPDPRRKALEVLLGCGGTSFDLSPRDEAFALRLARETTVWRGRLDFAISRSLHRQLRSLDAGTLMLLRLGAAQLLILETPAHAAVTETVKLAGNPGARGLVNAVLRRLASQGEDEGAPLHIRWSHPELLVRRWLERFGQERTRALLEWNNQPPPLGGYAFGAPPPGEPGLYLQGYRRFQRGIPLPPEGVFVQDEAAAVVARAFRSIPGGTALEIGAAPGGKTAHQDGSSLLVSLDSSWKRMETWCQNRDRLGWGWALPVVADGAMMPFTAGFHKILVDAPCTNTGVFRRRPGARWKWSPGSGERLAGIQSRLLEAASRLVAPGGVLFYSTCSLEQEENQQVARRFEHANPGFERLPLDLPAALEQDGTMVSFPPESGVDGMFAAAWTRRVSPS